MTEQEQLKEVSVSEYAELRGGVNRNNIAFQAKNKNMRNLPGVKEIKLIGDRYSFIINPDQVTPGRRIVK